MTPKKELTEIQKSWVAALRSGEYKQGQHRLVTVTGSEKTYCCLGVLCDLYQKAKGDMQVSENETDGVKYLIYGEEKFYLPVKVQVWSGVKSGKGAYTAISEPTDLGLANDDGKSFLKIADIIEQHADELFV